MFFSRYPCFLYFVCIFCYRQKNVYREQLPVLKVEGLITFLAFENIYCHGSPWYLGMLVLSDCIYIFLWLLSALKSCKQKAEMKPEAFHFYPLKCLWSEIFFISLFQIAFKMTKNGVYFIVIAFLVAELFKFWFMQIIIRGLVTSQCVHSDVKSQKIEYLLKLFLYRTETLYSCYTHQ